jgi:DNA-binding transcriptional ArsR family regulator
MAAKKKQVPVERMEINDLETLKIITDPTRLSIIEALSVPRSVTEIAESLEVPRTRLYHHIKLLEGHGLIRVASTRKKGALAEKLYEPSARSFTPGEALLESEDGPERVEAIVTAVLDSTREDLRRSLLKHWVDHQPGEPEETSLVRAMVRLQPKEADKLIKELTALMDRYRNLHPKDEESDQTRTYALTLLFYPSSRDHV